MTPYAEADLFNLKFAQSADTLYIAHPSYTPQVLTRTGHTSWTIGAFSPSGATFNTTDNHPGCVAFFQQRLFWAGTNNGPQTIWASKSGSYTDYGASSPVQDDDGFSYTIVSDKVDRILWMIPDQYMMVGTSGGVWKFGASGDTITSGVITPTNVIALRQVAYSSKDLAGVLVNDRVLYVTRDGRKLRELTYQIMTSKYSAPDLTILAEHILDPYAIQMDFQQSPYTLVWVIRSDGQLCGMTFESDEKVIGWCRAETDGEYESVAVISEPDQEGREVAGFHR